MDLVYIFGTVAVVIAIALWFLRADPDELDEKNKAYFKRLYRRDSRNLNSRH